MICIFMICIFMICIFIYVYSLLFVPIQVLRGYSRTDGLLANYCDGAMYKAHSLFSAYSENPPLQIMAYYDDVEVCNPLGSHANKHKLGTK